MDGPSFPSPPPKEKISLPEEIILDFANGKTFSLFNPIGLFDLNSSHFPVEMSYEAVYLPTFSYRGPSNPPKRTILFPTTAPEY